MEGWNYGRSGEFFIRTRSDRKPQVSKDNEHWEDLLPLKMEGVLVQKITTTKAERTSTEGFDDLFAVPNMDSGD